MKILECFENIGSDHNRLNKPYVIAEAGVNHEGSMDIAHRLIEEAAEGGADAIKFQTYKANMLAVRESPAYWDLGTQFDLFAKYDRLWKPEYETLKLYCDRVGIEFMSTPFDTDSVEFLSELMDVFKISSSDITNKPFIENICKCGKPVILSTGASDLEEIDEALGWIDESGVPVALMHCVLNYPTINKDAHLGMIKGLKKAYPDRMIGYSDHTLPGDMKSLEVATLLGADILEKHFTHDKELPGNDHYHSMDKHDLASFLVNIESVSTLFGEQNKRALKVEETARLNARRSFVAACLINKNSTIFIA